MDKISDGRIDIADNDEPTSHIGASGKEFNGGKVQNHDEAPVGDGFHHRSFPTPGTLLLFPDFPHLAPLWLLWYGSIADTPAPAQPFNSSLFDQPVQVIGQGTAGLPQFGGQLAWYSLTSPLNSG